MKLFLLKYAIESIRQETGLIRQTESGVKLRTDKELR